MTDVRKLELKKHKVIKDDGRYLIYFTFEQEGSQAGGDATPADGEAQSASGITELENGEQE